MKFTKMHGIGNDYIYIDAVANEVSDPAGLSRRLSERHFGVGSDGLVLILPSEICDFRMRMFNPDGTEAEMCGNASRCVAKYVYDRRMTDKKEFTLETGAGVKYVTVHTDEMDEAESVTIDMGEPILKPSLVPVSLDGDVVVDREIVVDGTPYRITCVSMGNPHCIIYTENIGLLDIKAIGPKIESFGLFPRKTNVEFVEVIDESNIKMRVWERGTGETLACGTGACATLVASVLNGKSDRKATLHLLGGDLELEWDKTTKHVLMTGPAVTVYEGELK